MEQSGIEVGVRAIRKWWEPACRENRRVRMQTSIEKKQSGIEVGVRAMKKKRGARCCLQQTDFSF